MPRDKLSQVLHDADPNLTIVPGHSYHRRRSNLTNHDWEKGKGIICRECRREVFRSRDGLCMNHWDKTNEIEIRDKAGALQMIPLTDIMDICKKPPGEELVVDE